MAKVYFDPWTRVRTIHNLPADEVISAIQKEIRRGNSENAILCAYEMIDTSLELENYLWDRLAVISIEDIGFGDTFAPLLVDTLQRLSHRFARGEGDRYMFAIHAVRYLASREKDRSTNEIFSWIANSNRYNSLVPEIPDYAIDLHTERGKTMGRGNRHYYEEGTKLYPEMPGADKTYRQRLIDLLKENNNW